MKSKKYFITCKVVEQVLTGEKYFIPYKTAQIILMPVKAGKVEICRDLILIYLSICYLHIVIVTFDVCWFIPYTIAFSFSDGNLANYEWLILCIFLDRIYFNKKKRIKDFRRYYILILDNYRNFKTKNAFKWKLSVKKLNLLKAVLK